MSTEQARLPSARKGAFFIFVILAVIAGIVAFVFVQRGDASAVNVPSEAPRPLPVNAARVEYVGALNINELYTGLVVARRTSALGFETGGRIALLNADLGDEVSEGEVLAHLDTRSLNARLQAADAQINEAKASLRLAETTRERQAFLVENDLLSSQSFDEVETQVDAANARLAAAEAQASSLRIQIELSSIRAPFSGVITERAADEGAIAAPGVPVLTLVETGALEIRIGVPVDIASRLAVGETYEMRVESQIVPVTLRSKTGVIGASQRTMTVVFDLPENAGVSPGSVARLEMEEALDQSGFWIPVSAMTEASRGLWAIFAIVPDAHDVPRVEKRLVDIVHAEANRVFVRGALEDGEMFVVDGLHRLVPGQSVAPNAAARS